MKSYQVEKLKIITNVAVPVTVTSKVGLAKLSAPSVKSGVLWWTAPAKERSAASLQSRKAPSLKCPARLVSQDRRLILPTLHTAFG